MTKTTSHGSLPASLSASILSLELRLSTKIRQFEELVGGLRSEAALLKDLGCQSSATLGADAPVSRQADSTEREDIMSNDITSNASPSEGDEAFDFTKSCSESRRRRGARFKAARSRTQTWPLETGQEGSECAPDSRSASRTLPALPPVITVHRASIASAHPLLVQKPPLPSPAPTPLASLAFRKQKSLSPSPSFTTYKQQLTGFAQLPTVSNKRHSRGRYSGLMSRMTQAVNAARFGRCSIVSDNAIQSQCSSPSNASSDSAMNTLPNLMIQHAGEAPNSTASSASRKSMFNLPPPALTQDQDAAEEQEDQQLRASTSSARTPRHTSFVSGEFAAAKSGCFTSANYPKTSESAFDDLRFPTEESLPREASYSNVSHHSTVSEALSLSTSDPGVELLPFWQDMRRTSRRKKPEAKRGSSRSVAYSDPMGSSDLIGVVSGANPSSEAREGRVVRFIARRVMMAPTSPGSFCWDVLGMVFITYDFIYMPLEAFSLPETAFTVTAEWTVMIFWTLTIPRTLLVGYVKEDGEIVLNPVKVIRRYVTNWFLIDLVIVGCDWAGVILQGVDSLGVVRITKIVRMARIMRILRVARMLKAPALAEQLVERFQSEKALLMLGIVVHSCMFLGLVHILACLWYMLGKEVSEEANGTWISVYNVDVAEFSYKYFTSLHWAATQFIGTMEVNPQNNSERIFAAIVCILSFIISTAFVSLLTSKITRLQMISESWENQFSILRQYCQHHRIPSMLTMRVMRSARHALRMQQKHVLEKDIELLAVISEPLQMEMRSKIFCPLMCRNPFFDELNSICFRTLRRLCHFATNVLPMQTGDVLFQAGEAPKVPRMFFVMSGKLAYSWCCTSWPAQHGEYFGEAALWTCWVHTGDMIAATDSNVLEIRLDGFRQQINSAVNDVKFYTASYAEAYVRAMNQTKDMMELSQHIDTGRLAREAREIMSRRSSVQ